MKIMTKDGIYIFPTDTLFLHEHRKNDVSQYSIWQANTLQDDVIVTRFLLGLLVTLLRAILDVGDVVDGALVLFFSLRLGAVSLRQFLRDLRQNDPSIQDSLRRYCVCVYVFCE